MKCHVEPKAKGYLAQKKEFQLNGDQTSLRWSTGEQQKSGVDGDGKLHLRKRDLPLFVQKQSKVPASVIPNG